MRIYEIVLLAMCIWREARGEDIDGKIGVAWSIRNRVMKPSWWGTTWTTVILKPWQYSSFNSNDPNAVKWPAENDQSWLDSMTVANEIYAGNGDDPTRGSTHYFDKSLDGNPPSWAATMTWKVDIGNLHFYS